MTPETAMAGVLRDELRRNTTPESRHLLACSYERDAARLEHLTGMESWAPLYRDHARKLRAG